jgi:hypothetical protein
MKKKRRLKPPKEPSKEYRAVWRVVDGAIKKALDVHPNYLTSIGARYRTARMSIAKRVVGDIVSYLDRKAKAEQPRR